MQRSERRRGDQPGVVEIRPGRGAKPLQICNAARCLFLLSLSFQIGKIAELNRFKKRGFFKH